MVIKIIGAVLIVFSTSMAGFYFSQVDKYRIEDLRQMKMALNILKGEINFSYMPLSEAFLAISQRVTGSVAEITELAGERFSKKDGDSASDIWQEVLAHNVTKTYFTKEDMDMLFSFGKALGYLDRQQQVNNIELAIIYINQTEEMLLQRSLKNSKIYRSMGVLGGTLLAVILF